MKNKILVKLYPCILLIFIAGCKFLEPAKPKEPTGDLSVTTVRMDGWTPVPLANVNINTKPVTKTYVTDSFGSTLLSELAPGSYEIYATLPGYGSGKAVVRVVENELENVTIMLESGTTNGVVPEIKMILPATGASFSDGMEVTFSADITDADSPAGSLLVLWESSLDGVLSTGAPGSNGNITFKKKLSKGLHTITVTATDSDKYSSKVEFLLSTQAPKAVVLESVTKDAAGDIELKWSKYPDNDFQSYEVYRSHLPASPNATLVSTITDVNKRSYIDDSFGFVDQVYYSVRIVTKQSDGRNSNELGMEKPAGEIFSINPYDAVIHPTENKLYVIDREAKKLFLINLETFEQINTISLSGVPGKMDVGNNGMGVEIYIPSSDGWVYCYDAETLNQKKSVNAGYYASSVTSNNNGYLAVAMNNQWTRPVAVFNRVSGMEISAWAFGALYGGAILRMVPKTNNIIAISTAISPIDMDFLSLDSKGNILSQVDDLQHGEYPLDPHVFRIAPSGEYTVTGREGAVYSTSSAMEYKGQIQRGSLEFSDFAFSENGNTIFGATSNRKSVQIISYPSLSRSEEKLLRGYPVFIFRKNSTLYTVCRVDEGNGRVGLQSIKIQ
jgi:hypothetical protein